MRQIIEGRSYNTETATEIGSYKYGTGPSDFDHIEESLYITKQGAYFLAGSGGANTDYCTCNGNSSFPGHRITPITREQALIWCEKHVAIDDIDVETYFPDLVQEA